ncbi:MAG: hypothetical protein MK171_02700 [Pirellulales bacterium]|nr:hypothetical protein [Pirellulales bacterium]
MLANDTCSHIVVNCLACQTIIARHVVKLVRIGNRVLQQFARTPAESLTGRNQRIHRDRSLFQ